MSDVAAVKQIVQSIGGCALRDNEAAELAKEATTMVTRITELANRLRRHRFGRYLSISDVNEALSSLKMKPLLGYHSSYHVYDYVSIGKTKQHEIFAVDEPQIKLSTVAQAKQPEYIYDDVCTFHWLAYRGNQPKIHENLVYVFFLEILISKHAQPCFKIRIFLKK